MAKREPTGGIRQITKSTVVIFVLHASAKPYRASAKMRVQIGVTLPV
jgi:hypothetical protein